MRTRTFLMAGGGMALFLFILLNLSVAGPAVAADRMPQFALPSVHDNVVIDSRSYQGQTLLINFFATWCPPCRKEIPSLVTLQKKYGPRGFAVVGISTDEGGSALVARFAEKMGVNYPVLLGDPQTMKNFGGIIGIPTTFLVNSQGIIVRRYEGYTEQKILEKELDRLLP